jgi:hypothetical protein
MGMGLEVGGLWLREDGHPPNTSSGSDQRRRPQSRYCCPQTLREQRGNQAPKITHFLALSPKAIPGARPELRLQTPQEGCAFIGEASRRV